MAEHRIALARGEWIIWENQLVKVRTLADIIGYELVGGHVVPLGAGPSAIYDEGDRVISWPSGGELLEEEPHVWAPAGKADSPISNGRSASTLWSSLWWRQRKRTGQWLRLYGSSGRSDETR